MADLGKGVGRRTGLPFDVERMYQGLLGELSGIIHHTRIGVQAINQLRGEVTGGVDRNLEDAYNDAYLAAKVAQIKVEKALREAEGAAAIAGVIGLQQEVGSRVVVARPKDRGAPERDRETPEDCYNRWILGQLDR